MEEFLNLVSNMRYNSVGNYFDDGCPSCTCLKHLNELVLHQTITFHYSDDFIVFYKTNENSFTYYIRYRDMDCYTFELNFNTNDYFIPIDIKLPNSTIHSPGPVTPYSYFYNHQHYVYEYTPETFTRTEITQQHMFEVIPKIQDLVKDMFTAAGGDINTR